MHPGFGSATSAVAITSVIHHKYIVSVIGQLLCHELPAFHVAGIAVQIKNESPALLFFDEQAMNDATIWCIECYFLTNGCNGRFEGFCEIERNKNETLLQHIINKAYAEINQQND